MIYNNKGSSSFVKELDDNVIVWSSTESYHALQFDPYRTMVNAYYNRR